MKNKNIIVNYCKCWDKKGYTYTQQIKINDDIMEKYNKYLIQEKQKRIKNFIYSENDLKILSLDQLKKGVNFINLIQLDLFTQFYLKEIYTPPKKDKNFERILYRNTVIIVK